MSVQNGINGSSSSDDEAPSHQREPIPAAPQEEERTLTDHLNKRLLQSFLTRLEEGGFVLPQNTTPTEERDKDEDSFENEN